MKGILSTNFDLNVNNVNAVTFYGDGTNITGVESIPYYSWVGLIKVTGSVSQLIKIQGDDYFGDLSITQPYSATDGVDITSSNGSIFTNNKTFFRPPKIMYAIEIAHGTTATITETTITLKLGNNNSSVPPERDGLFSSFEIKVFK